MKAVSGKKFCRILKKQGWQLVQSRGSHFKFVHPERDKPVIVPVHGNRDLRKGTQKALMKQAGITEDML